MAKKKVHNYDDEVLGRYIRQLENPDSIGWDAITSTWVAPTLPGYDSRNRGMGVDVYNNEAAARISKDRPGKYLTEQEERDLRNGHILYSYGAIDRNASKDTTHTLPFIKDMSERKVAEAVGLIYRGDMGQLRDASTTLGKAYRSDNEEDFHQA